jgi:antitoxin PrlF
MSVATRKRLLGTMTSKGQTTVPKEVRDLLGLSEGAQVEWILEDGKVTVKPRTLRAVDLAGILGPPPNGKIATIEDMNEAIGQAVAERFERKTRQ